MSSIKTNIYGAALEYGLEDHKGVESCRQQITSQSLRGVQFADIDLGAGSWAST